MHGLGYAHADIKPENICVRKNREGKLKFTLIDFGISQRLAHPSSMAKDENFRGNLMFCSDRQIDKYKPTRFCDLMALILMGYFIIFGEVPSTELANKMLAADPLVNIYSASEFYKHRVTHRRRFQLEIASPKNPFWVLCQHLNTLRDQQMMNPSRHANSIIGSIDYDHLLTMIPSDFQAAEEK